MNAATTRATRPGPFHRGSAYVRQGPVHAERRVPRPTAPSASGADQQQAEYFVGLLTQSARALSNRIGNYQKAIAVSEACGDAERTRSFRQMSRAEEKERRAVEELITSLRRRFPLLAAVEVSSGPRRSRPVVR